MIARLKVLLPYYFSIPYQANLLPYEFDYDEYKVKAYPPKQANLDYSALSIHSEEPAISAVDKLDEKQIVSANNAIKINGHETINANLFQLDILAKRDFNREKNSSECDPPIEMLMNLVDVHLGKLRTIGGLSHLRYVGKRDIAWKIEYLADDGTLLDKSDTERRKFFQSKIEFKVTPISEATWHKACSLPLDYKPPLWDSLLLDSFDLFPEVNASIVLANAALETCINHSLGVLAKNSSLSEESWNWIKRDDNFAKQPSIKEKFDQMLLLVCGRSLMKEESKLWQAFVDLRGARNSMVHQGKAYIKRGKKDVEVTPDLAFEMISNAGAIIEWIENLLPSEFKEPAPIITNVRLSKNMASEDTEDEIFLLGVKTNVKNFEISKRSTK